MQEELVRIPAEGGFELEGRMISGREDHCAVVCHPLPRYGGTMDSPVVITAQRAFAALGGTALRFNFRGVGGSGGRSESGAVETADLEAAVDFLRLRYGSAVKVHLLGYSYGAWIVGQAVSRGLEAASVSLISPPVDFLDHQDITLPALPTIVVSGDLDQFGAADSVDRWLAAQPEVAQSAERVTLRGVDHFYTTGEARLGEALSAFLRTLIN